MVFGYDVLEDTVVEGTLGVAGVYEWSRERSFLPDEEQGLGWPECSDAFYPRGWDTPDDRN
jgi:hypothetical protein